MPIYFSAKITPIFCILICNPLHALCSACILEIYAFDLTRADCAIAPLHVAKSVHLQYNDWRFQQFKPTHHVLLLISTSVLAGSSVNTCVVKLVVGVDNGEIVAFASGAGRSPSDPGATAPLGHVPSRIHPACRILIFRREKLIN